MRDKMLTIFSRYALVRYAYKTRLSAYLNCKCIFMTLNRNQIHQTTHYAGNLDVARQTRPFMLNRTELCHSCLKN